MTGRLIDPVTGQPFEDGPRAPMIPGPTRADVNSEPAPALPGHNGIIGLAIYDPPEEEGGEYTFSRFLTVDKDGALEESIVAQAGQVFFMLNAVARVVPNPGTTVSKVKAG